jgi:hypothetical protein
MQNRIAYYILSLLYLNGRVRIPGIGRIIQNRNSASVNEAEGTITPPQTSNDFEQDKQNKSRLLERFVAYKTQTSRTRARREIAKFSHEIKSGLKNDGRVELKYLGTLSRDGDAMHFTPNEELLNPGYSALQSVDLPHRYLTIAEDPHAMPDHTIPAVDASPSVAHETGDEQESSEHTIPEMEIPAPNNDLVVEKENTILIPLAQLKSETRPVAQVSPVTTPVEATRPERKRRTPLVLPITVLILLGLLVGAFLFYQSRLDREDVVAANSSRDSDQIEETSSTPTDLPENTNATETSIMQQVQMRLILLLKTAGPQHR